MRQGNRLPLAALLFSLILLGVVVLTRPAETPSVTLTPTRRVTSAVTIIAAIPPTPTAAPTFTPAPTLPPRPVDTTTLNEAVITPTCFLKVNPLLAGYNAADRDAAALIFEGLMTLDPYGAPIPLLAAETPRISGDGLTYVIRLRQDVRWQDGEPFSADDVAYTIALMQDPAFPGAAELYTFWRTVELDVLDPYTVRFTLAQPLGIFLDYLRIGILPEHALRGTSGEALRTHPFNLAPIGTGAYQFDGLIGDGTRLTGLRLRRATTHTARPEGASGYSVTTITLRCYPTWEDAIAAYSRGDVLTISDIPSSVVNQISSLPLLPLAAYRPALGAVIYNYTRDSVAFFRDQRMRRALALATDRQTLVTNYLKDRAIVADSPILPNSWAYAPGANCPTYNPDSPSAARDSLSLVQITPPPDPNTGVTPSEYRFELLVPNDAGLAALAQAMSDGWRERLSIRVDLVVVDATTFRERLIAGSFDAALVELNLAPSADPDPYSLWRQMPSEGGLNFGGLSDRLIAELVEEGRMATGAVRVDVYRRFQQTFCDRASALVIYFPVTYYGVDTLLSGVQLGFLSQPGDRFRTLREWVIAPSR
ncbi:MAG TPA: ABC transporter substrate-binding protein [Aggregatilineales bacterium]|nr:hypothetical protein [Anaerolineales bacterium]HRE48621.1 ABC transporter substrate-binding protein [Aggregatilineales bacterium]